MADGTPNLCGRCEARSEDLGDSFWAWKCCAIYCFFWRRWSCLHCDGVSMQKLYQLLHFFCNMWRLYCWVCWRVFSMTSLATMVAVWIQWVIWVLLCLYSLTGLILCLFVKPGYVKVGSFLTEFLPSKSLDLGSHIWSNVSEKEVGNSEKNCRFQW